MLLAGLAVPGRGLEPVRYLTQYGITSWQTQAGLPHNHVRQLAQTADGYLWVATPAGLARFDGAAFTRPRRRPVEEDPSGFQSSALAAAPDGSLWMAAAGGGLLRLREGGLSIAAIGPEPTGRVVHALLADSRGEIWVGSSAGAGRVAEGKQVRFDAASGLHEKSVRSLFEDSRRRVWAGTNRGIFLRTEAGRFVLQGGETTSIQAIAEDAEGRIWAGGGNAGLLRFDGRGWTRFGRAAGLPNENVRALRRDRDGNLWIGTDGGVAVFRDGRFLTFPGAMPLGHDSIWSILEDHEGGIWIGTRTSGLFRLGEGKFSNITRAEGLPHDEVSSVTQDAGGRIWIGMVSGGVAIWDRGKVLLLTRRDGLPQDAVWSLYPSRSGAVWAGTGGRGVARIEPGGITVYDARLGLTQGFVRVLFEDSRGALWAGTNGGGLYVLDRGRFRPAVQPRTRAHSFVWSIAEDSGGAVWAGTRAGLIRIQDGQVREFPEAGGAPLGTVFAIHPDAQGLWLGTDSGMARYRDGRIRRYTERDGLPTDHVLQLLEDDRQNLWLASSNGVHRVAKSEIERLDAGRTGTIAVATFDTDEGMASAECVGGHQPGAWKGSDGTLYFSTSGGVAVIHPGRIRINPAPPQVHLERVRIDGRDWNPRAEAQAEPGRGDVELHFTGLSFAAPKKTRFRHRLEGLDAGWVDAGTRRLAVYNNLAPGRYVFRVSACNNDGVWNQPGASFVFVLRPHYYQTGWFWTLCAAGIAGAAGIAHQLRLRRLQAGFAAILAERNRISRELHDTLAQGFTSLSLQLEAIARWLDRDPSQAAKHLDEARLMVRSSLAESRRAVWGLRPQALEDQDLAGALERLAAGTRGSGVQCELKVSGSRRKLERQTEDHLLRIAQESVANAARHASPSAITIHLAFLPDKVRMSVQDDGRGFDASAAPAGAHLGIRGMRERSEALAAEFSITSSPGEGTEVSVLAPAPAPEPGATQTGE